MDCNEIIFTTIIGIITGVIAGLISGIWVNKYLIKKEETKYLYIRDEIINHFLSDAKIYTQFFTNKPINCDKKQLVKKIVKNLNKILTKNIKIFNQQVEMKALLLQMNRHIDKILNNELEFKYHNWLSDKQLSDLFDISNNINLYLREDNVENNYYGVTNTLKTFLEDIDNFSDF